MSETWFTSDHHFGHANILKYEPDARPFTSLDEMHECLIERWNMVVGDADTVYCVGDFCFGKHNISIASRLKGQKKLVLGNHDTYPSADYLKYFDKLYGVLFWRRCIVSHVPCHPNGLGQRWMMNIHGHLHSKRVQEAVFNQGKIIGYIDDPNYFNVSVEQHNLTPVNADVIMEAVKELD